MQKINLNTQPENYSEDSELNLHSHNLESHQDSFDPMSAEQESRNLASNQDDDLNWDNHDLRQENSHHQLHSTNEENHQGFCKTMKGCMSKISKLTVALSLIAVVLGVMTGWGAFRLQNQGSEDRNQQADVIEQVPTGKIKNGDVFGDLNSEVFTDSAQGYLEKGGLEGEGSHQLLRAGGPSQTVYLTSSITDLDLFAGMEIKIYGETFKGQKVGWLMDVGKVEVINTEAQAPKQ